MNLRAMVLGSVGVSLAGAAALWFVLRDGEPPPVGNDAGRETTSPFAIERPLTGSPALAEAQLADFAAGIEQLIGGAAERVVTRGSGAEAGQAGPLSVAANRRVPDGEPLEREFRIGAAGAVGTVDALGFAFTRPWPARYEMSMLLDGFGQVATLTADGAVQYNFIRDDRTAPALQHGLFRARLTLRGNFAGDVDLHGEIAAGKVVSLVVLTGGDRTRLTFGGREPRPFVTYVSTIAGTGSPGNTNGPAREARFDRPAGVAVDRSGRVFIADSGNHAVRELSPNGELSTLAAAFTEPWDLAFDGLGLLVVSDRASRIADGQGPISRVVTGGELKGLVIRTVAAVGKNPQSGLPLCTQFACDGRSPIAQMTFTGGIEVEGAVVTVAQWAVPSGLRMVTPDGAALTLRGWSQGGCTPEIPGGPHDVVRGPRGELYFTTDCHAIWVLRADGAVEPIAGTPGTALGFADGSGRDAKFSYPAGIVFDGEHLYVSESNGSLLRRVDPVTGETRRLAGCLAHVEGFDCNNSTGFRDGPGDYAQFYNPENLALDPWGDLYVADTRNHAVRFVRIANDPERRPAIEQVQPLALQQGVAATLTVRGRDLGLARSVDLGPGIETQIVERGAKKLKIRVEVADSAPAGAHALELATPFGRATTRVGKGVNVIGERASRAVVRTISGNGAWEPGPNDIIPAEQAQFAFPGGIAAIDKERLLIADPLESRVRLLATKNGAARELLEIAAYQAGGQAGTMILQAIEGLEDFAGNVLGLFGTDNFTEEAREQLLVAIAAGLDKICEAARSDCEYLSLPWAGLPASPGNVGGFRLGARLFLPTDVAVAGDDKFLIADTGNRVVKTVGIDFSGTEPKPAPFQVANTDYLRDYPLAVVSTGEDTAVVATSSDSTVAKITLRDGSSVLSGFGGVRGAFRCKRADGDVRHPLGVPMGMASGKSGTFIADPYCGTIWRLDGNGEAQDLRGNLQPKLTPLPKCSDGPLVFATFNTPMDVAVDSQGNIWVADSGCHSIRVIKPLGAGDVRALLDQWAGGIADWLDTDAAAEVLALAGTQSLGEFDAARMWVTTVAGAVDGEAGFRDGAASDALFNAPVSLALAEDDDGLYVFVSDVGNKRIRLIDMSSRAATTRIPPADEAPPFRLPGPNDEPLSPLDAVNYLIAWAYRANAAQATADFTQAVLAFDDRYLARGTGSRNELDWELSLQIKNVSPNVGLLSPPGFTSASREGFAMAAPLVGTWRAGFSADLVGLARVRSRDATLFTWSPEVLDFGLGMRDLKVTADIDLDPSRAVPQLESASVHAQALIYGTGALAFNRPVEFNASPRDGALELRGQLKDERLDLGGLGARLDADLVLTIRPSPGVIEAVVGPSDDPWIDETIATTRVNVAIEGTLKAELQGVGEVGVPLAVDYDVSVPSSDALDVALRALDRPIPRVWGEGAVPDGFAIDPVRTPSAGEFAVVAAEVESALRGGHAPLGIVLSRLRPPESPLPAAETPAAPQPRQAVLPEARGEGPTLSERLDQESLTQPLASAGPIWMGEEDSAIWTAHYLAAASYRYAAEPSADARAGVELALGGIEALFDVTDGAVAVTPDLRAPVRTKGILSRTLMGSPADFDGLDFAEPLRERDCYYVKADGGWKLANAANAQIHASFAAAVDSLPPSERGLRAGVRGAAGATFSVQAAQIEPVGNVRYGYGCSDVQPVSRDQYIGVLMGLTVANRLVDDADVKARTQRLLEQALDFLVGNEWNIPLPPEERIRTNFIGNFEKQLAMLRIGKTFNPQKYAVLYDYVSPASELAWLPAWVSAIDIRSQYYKFNLLQSGLVTTLLLEDDPALRANYLAIMDMAWGAIGHHRNAYFDLLRVFARDPAQRNALLEMDSRYGQKEPPVTLRQEVGAVLGEWVARRNNERLRSSEGLLFNGAPDVEFIVGLWPNKVGEYIMIDGTEQVLALKALPVDKRPSRESMDFIWQRQPFEVAMKGAGAPTRNEILDNTEGFKRRWREAPGVDYLIAYWLARYLNVLPPP